eukprot:scaffold317656_cov13-Tisochrysis_lutea.AAC.1
MTSIDSSHIIGGTTHAFSLLLTLRSNRGFTQTEELKVSTNQELCQLLRIQKAPLEHFCMSPASLKHLQCIPP